MSTRSYFGRDTETHSGPYRWRSYYGAGMGGWSSVERRNVEPGTVRLIAGHLYAACIIEPRWWGIGGYEVSWHRVDSLHGGTPTTTGGDA